MGPLHVVILAAGLGTRMRTTKPKVLHCIAGKPLLQHVLETAQCLEPETIHVIYGIHTPTLQTTFAAPNIHWILQKEAQGTADAVKQALPYLPSEARVLILYGDVPFVSLQSLENLLKPLSSNSASCLSLLLAKLEEPTGLGRIIRSQSEEIKAIVEEKDASPAQKAIQEIYTGICATRAAALKAWLPQLKAHNQQKEYYLTEIVELAVAEKTPIFACHTETSFEAQGINDLYQLQTAERFFQEKQAKAMLLAGVRLADAKRIDIRGELSCSADVFIDFNCLFIGMVSIGRGSTIGPNCVLKDVSIGENCEIHSHSLIEGSSLADGAQIGPFARIRPGTELGAHAKVGNFVEIKNTCLGAHSKASHLSYLGDARIGPEVNIGAGTITCNYDGANKHQTIIEEGAFIGSDTQLVAPVCIGKYATIGAGSTIRKDAPAHALTLTESKQKTVSGWKRPLKAEKDLQPKSD